MELDIKNLGDQDMKQLVKSLELVSARVLDSVVRASQLASAATPEMQALFAEWVGCLGGDVGSLGGSVGGVGGGFRLLDGLLRVGLTLRFLRLPG